MVQPTIRYHSIKARHSGGTNSNHISFHIHNADSTTSQVEALKILGSGNLTFSQQAMTVLVNADNFTLEDGDNGAPLDFATTYINKGGMSVNSNKDRITVPLSGTYLVTGQISGTVTTESQGDGIQFSIRKNGSSSFTGSSDAYGFESLGSENEMEWSFNVTLPVTAGANDYFELTLDNIGTTVVGTVNRGYFSVTKLH